MAVLRSGRTERMLRQVAKDVKSNKKVYIMVCYLDHARQMRDRLYRLVDDESLIYKNVIFTTPNDNKIDSRNGFALGASDASVYADHTVFETKCQWLFEQWKRWNELDDHLNPLNGNWDCQDKTHDIECDLDEDCTCK